jgi:hypothetical protein
VEVQSHSFKANVALMLPKISLCSTVKLHYKVNLTIVVCKLGHASASLYLVMWTFHFGHIVGNIIHKVC